MLLDGAQLFVRYAYPPNSHGSCGPRDSDAILHYGQSGVTDEGLAGLASQFAGAWPYLELIALANGIPDPLDHRVVEAYWVGNPLLGNVDVAQMGRSMEERFRARTGIQFGNVLDDVLAGGVPHHSFHVFDVYPWVGLLTGDRRFATALNVLDKCRVRWGRVVSLSGDEAVVRSLPLTWDANQFSVGQLAIGEPSVETVRCAVSGTGFLNDLAPGDVVSLHWDWICDRLTPLQLNRLHHYTEHHLRIVNAKIRTSKVRARSTAASLA